MHKLDDSFRKAKDARSARKRRERQRRVFLWTSLAVLALVGMVVVATLVWGPIRFGPRQLDQGVSPETIDAEAPDVFIPAIVDLPGNPLRISLGDDVAMQTTRTFPRPDAVPAERAATEVALLSDVMLTTSERFMTTLPSSARDFEFYQTQRASTAAAMPVSYEPDTGTPEATPPGDAALTSDLDEGSGWGDSLTEGDGEASFERTAIENTTSVAVVRPETERFAPTSEYKARITADTPLDRLMIDNGFSVADAPIFAKAMLRLLGRDALHGGDVVAIRGVRASQRAPRLRPVALSLYSAGRYVGTLTRSDANLIVKGTDPWVYDNLFNYVGDQQVAEAGRQYRLLDAIYSTAVRNKVPTGVLGEAIMLMSRSFDLDAFAAAGDRLQLAYANDGLGDEGGSGRVLYVAVKGPDRDMQCYVLRATDDGDYSCFNDRGTGNYGTVPNGMFTPVRGTLTSTFGPRKHPIFKQVKPHTGVDWAAPVGTPVSAAFDGKISYAGNGGGYGNLLKIAHSDGRETYYAHLSRFADSVVVGMSVKAGDLVGYVGTTGNSTGPHLHFEIRIAGTPIDPLQPKLFAPAQDDGIAVAEGSAVEDLTERIVRVESGGDPNAKNPKSSATGAGQFITSTWLRMMQTYEPELAASMSQAELLALRTDPTISREMVANLAREGEAYLKARGHSITTGRLYLCHFLGMQDAHVVLSVDGSTPLEGLLSAAVIAANKSILEGKNAADVINWAEKLMNRHYTPSTRVTEKRVTLPPGFDVYEAAIDALLTAMPRQAMEAPTDPTGPVPEGGRPDPTLLTAERRLGGGTRSVAIT